MRRVNLFEGQQRASKNGPKEVLRDEWQEPDSSDTEPQREARKLQGQSLVKYSRRQIDHKNTLLGNRYLCRGAGQFIVAPSGHGKSVLAAQAAIELACGRPTFDISNPNGPLKSLIIQAEDDDDDITEMSQIVTHLELSNAEIQMVDDNTHVEFVNDLTGANFLNACNDFLNQWEADILWINPYTAYLGADIKDDGENTKFLRNGLNPILTSHKCGGIIIHHTPKTNNRDTTDWKPSDWMYSGAGAAVLTNWARAYLVIDPTDIHGIYKFIAAKRGKRIGWGDAFPIYETLWAHSRDEGKLLWEPADRDQIASTQAAADKKPDDLLKLIPILDPILQDALFIKAKVGLGGMGEKKVRQFIKILIHDGKAFEHPMKREGIKGAKGYARTPPTDD